MSARKFITNGQGAGIGSQRFYRPGALWRPGDELARQQREPCMPSSRPEPTNGPLPARQGRTLSARTRRTMLPGKPYIPPCLMVAKRLRQSARTAAGLRSWRWSGVGSVGRRFNPLQATEFAVGLMAPGSKRSGDHEATDDRSNSAAAGNVASIHPGNLTNLSSWPGP